MAEKITVGIFDVGGVLNHFDRHSFHAGIIKATGLVSTDQVEAYYELWPQVSRPLHTGKRPERDISDQFKKLTGIDLQLLQQPSDSPLTTVFSQISQPNTETLTLVAEVQANGLQTAIVSDSTQPHASALEGSVIYELFDKRLRVLSHEVGFRKPDFEIYREAIGRLGIKPSEAFFIDDVEKNVDAAIKLGMYGIVFQSATQARTDLKKLGIKL